MAVAVAVAQLIAGQARALDTRDRRVHTLYLVLTSL